ncbi:hypothetical protein YDYSY3_38300 [Paenibacillus chitinolyticus]|uniref:hypothetical protein n=1 Tax=Paenibacillus chitinolyticus TaxID=79263 RepID=UPI0026E49DC0|nr:hypothetical protein [Paenibacillus chitinolyticus]GKS12830.1 hypothetical protein YDYSY3_38300 [Paenibacillus chitinolyticus]
MARLKFEMWKDRDGNIMSRFTDGKGRSTDSYWASPPESIDHVGPEYLPQRYRHPNVKGVRHIEFVKRRFKEEVKTLKLDTIGTMVIMVDCIEAEMHKDKVWTTRSKPWKLGNGAEVVLLVGLSGGFSTKCLKLV